MIPVVTHQTLKQMYTAAVHRLNQAPLHFLRLIRSAVKEIGSQFGTVTSVTALHKHNRSWWCKNSYHVDYGKGGHAIDIVPKRGH
jgi:hypothetical protein